MDKLLLAIKLAPVAIQAMKGLGNALKWLGYGIIRAGSWAEEIYIKMLVAKQEADKS